MAFTHACYGNKEWLVQEGTTLGKDLLKSVMVASVTKNTGWYFHFSMFCWEKIGLELASPEQTATSKDMSNPLHGCDGVAKNYWKLLFFDVATSFDSVVHRVHVVSFDTAVFNVADTVSAAAGSPCIYCSSSIPADYVPAGHVLISADRYRIC
ncbi:hypothetical protein Tco_0496791 [Tanacetum coccineum]